MNIIESLCDVLKILVEDKHNKNIVIYENNLSYVLYRCHESSAAGALVKKEVKLVFFGTFAYYVTQKNDANTDWQ